MADNTAVSSNQVANAGNRSSSVRRNRQPPHTPESLHLHRTAQRSTATAYQYNAIAEYSKQISTKRRHSSSSVRRSHQPPHTPESLRWHRTAQRSHGTLVLVVTANAEIADGTASCFNVSSRAELSMALRIQPTFKRLRSNVYIRTIHR
jgi:hypothetical protein